MQYPATELVLDKNGNVYHLGLSSKDISSKIILVGDQNRVNLVASLFDSIEHSSQHREFACKTGTYMNKHITVLSTGIGTDNIDITISELDAIANIDIANRRDKSNFKSLDIIRIGTCGILQPKVPINSFILSTYALGLDNVAHFYDVKFTEEEENLKEQILKQVNLPPLIKPYLVKASEKINEKIKSEKTIEGITITSSGFYGPQGRTLRLKNKVSNINQQLTNFSSEHNKIINFEMESSALFALGKSLGHNCGTICLGIGNRPNKEFSKDYKGEMIKLIQYVIDRI